MATIVAALAVTALARVVPDEPLKVTGALTLTWRGDPGRGCAAAGLCGIQGSLILHPRAFSDLSPGGDFLPLDASATVRVRDGAAATGAECLDGLANGASLRLSRPGHVRLVVSLAGASLSSGRCAGPLAQELSTLSWLISRTAGKRPSFDLRTTRAFTAGPFAGTLTSTLRLKPNTSSDSQSFSSSSSSSSQSMAAPPRHRLVERVELVFHVSSLYSSLRTEFAALPGSTCAQLAVCGGNGSVALSLAGWKDTLFVEASRVVHRRFGARRALEDLGAGRLSVSAGLLRSFDGVSTRVQEVFNSPGEPQCRDGAAAGATLNFGAPRPAGALRALPVELNSGFLSDPLRTHCPGPSSSGGFQNPTVLARGSLPIRQLLERSVELALIAGGRFTSPGFAGARGGHVQLALRRFRVTAGTYREGL